MQAKQSCAESKNLSPSGNLILKSKKKNIKSNSCKDEYLLLVLLLVAQIKLTQYIESLKIYITL